MSPLCSQTRFLAVRCWRCVSGSGGRCHTSSCSASRPWRGEVPPWGQGQPGAPAWGQLWGQSIGDAWVFLGILVLAAVLVAVIVCHLAVGVLQGTAGTHGDLEFPQECLMSHPRVDCLTGSFPPSPSAQVWTLTGCTGSVATWPPSRNCATRWSMVRSPAVTVGDNGV